MGDSFSANGLGWCRSGRDRRRSGRPQRPGRAERRGRAVRSARAPGGGGRQRRPGLPASRRRAAGPGRAGPGRHDRWPRRLVAMVGPCAVGDGSRGGHAGDRGGPSAPGARGRPRRRRGHRTVAAPRWSEAPHRAATQSAQHDVGGADDADPLPVAHGNGRGVPRPNSSNNGRVLSLQPASPTCTSCCQPSRAADRSGASGCGAGLHDRRNGRRAGAATVVGRSLPVIRHPPAGSHRSTPARRRVLARGPAVVEMNRSFPDQ